MLAVSGSPGSCGFWAGLVVASFVLTFLADSTVARESLECPAFLASHAGLPFLLRPILGCRLLVHCTEHSHLLPCFECSALIAVDVELDELVAPAADCKECVDAMPQECSTGVRRMVSLRGVTAATSTFVVVAFENTLPDVGPQVGLEIFLVAVRESELAESPIPFPVWTHATADTAGNSHCYLFAKSSLSTHTLKTRFSQSYTRLSFWFLSKVSKLWRIRRRLVNSAFIGSYCMCATQLFSASILKNFSLVVLKSLVDASTAGRLEAARCSRMLGKCVERNWMSALLTALPPMRCSRWNWSSRSSCWIRSLSVTIHSGS